MNMVIAARLLLLGLANDDVAKVDADVSSIKSVGA